MTQFEQILSRHSRVIMVGFPNVGKSKLTGTVTDRPVYCSDDVPDGVDFRKSAYHWLDKVESDKGPWLLEGCMCFRVLRIGLRYREWGPDAVVYIEPMHEPQERHESFEMALLTVWDDYLELREECWSKVPIYEGTEVSMRAPA